LAWPAEKKSGTAITDVALDAPTETIDFAREQLFPPKDEWIGPLPEGATDDYVDCVRREQAADAPEPDAPTAP
jgi:hypothetical protein